MNWCVLVDMKIHDIRSATLARCIRWYWRRTVSLPQKSRFVAANLLPTVTLHHRSARYSSSGCSARWPPPPTAYRGAGLDPVRVELACASLLRVEMLDPASGLVTYGLFDGLEAVPAGDWS